MAWLLAALVLAACAMPGPAGGPAGPAPAPAGETRITFLQVNDHYSLEPVDDGRRGGMARLATLVRRIRRDSPHTLFVLAGDTLSPSVLSTFLKGEPMIAALNAVGLDVATFGNHEFDFGPDVLRQRMGESRFIWLSANVLDRRSERPFGSARADLLRALGGVTVGLFGLTTPESGVTSSPGPDVVFHDPQAVGRRVSADLRRRGARLVVAVTHQDMASDRALAGAADVDLILGGHEHEPLVAEEGKTLITKAGADARYLVQVDLWVDADGRLTERSFAFHEVGARIPPDPAVAILVAGYTERLGGELDVVVGRTAVALEARRARLRTEETNVGDFVADLVRARMGSDVALVNGGAIRADRLVPAGPLTRRDVWAFLPFATVVVTLELSGTELRRALEHGLAQRDRQGGGFLQVSGLRLVYDPRRPPGERLRRVEVGGAPLDPDRRYTVAVPDYLARGGDGFAVLRAARVLVGEASGPPLTALVLEAVSAQPAIAPAVDGRIRAAGE